MSNKFKVGDYWIDSDNDVMEIMDVCSDGRIELKSEHGMRYTYDSKNKMMLNLCGDTIRTKLLYKTVPHTVPSMSFKLNVIPGNGLKVGCQRINRRDTLKIFKILAKELGYELEG